MLVKAGGARDGDTLSSPFVCYAHTLLGNIPKFYLVRSLVSI